MSPVKSPAELRSAAGKSRQSTPKHDSARSRGGNAKWAAAVGARFGSTEKIPQRAPTLSLLAADPRFGTEPIQEGADASIGEIVGRFSEAIADGSLWAVITGHPVVAPKERNFLVDDPEIYGALDEKRREQAAQPALANEAEIAKLKRLIDAAPSHVWDSAWSDSDRDFAVELLRRLLAREPSNDPRVVYDRIRPPIVARYRRWLRRMDEARRGTVSKPGRKWRLDTGMGPLVDEAMTRLAEVQMKINASTDPLRSWFETDDSYGPNELRSLARVLRLYRLGNENASPSRERETPADIMFWSMRAYRWRTDPKLTTSSVINGAVINSAINVVGMVSGRVPKRAQALRPNAAAPAAPIPSDGLAPWDPEASFQARINRGAAPRPIANATDTRDGSLFSAFDGAASEPAGTAQHAQASVRPAGTPQATQAPKPPASSGSAIPIAIDKDATGPIVRRNPSTLRAIVRALQKEDERRVRVRFSPPQALPLPAAGTPRRSAVHPRVIVRNSSEIARVGTAPPREQTPQASEVTRVGTAPVREQTPQAPPIEAVGSQPGQKQLTIAHYKSRLDLALDRAATTAARPDAVPEPPPLPPPPEVEEPLPLPPPPEPGEGTSIWSEFLRELEDL